MLKGALTRALTLIVSRMLLRRSTVFAKELRATHDQQELTRTKQAAEKKLLQTLRSFKVKLEEAKARGDRSGDAYLVLENAYAMQV